MIIQVMPTRFDRESRHLKFKMKRLDERLRRQESLRLATFFIALGVGLFLERSRLPLYFQLVTVALFGLFAWTVSVHGRIVECIASFQTRRDFSECQKARSSLDWNRIPELSLEERAVFQPRHFIDLDLIEGRSLFRALNLTISRAGFAALCHRFNNFSISASEGKHRQKLVRELIRLQVYRRKFLVLAKKPTRTIESEALLSLVKDKFHTAKAVTYFRITAAVHLLTAALFLAFYFGSLQPYFVFSLVLSAYVYQFATKEIFISKAYASATSLESQLFQLRQLAYHIRRLPKTALPELHALLEPFLDERAPIGLLSKMERLLGRLGIRQNYLIHFAVNLVVPWDLYWTLRLEQVRQQIELCLPLWLECLAELEVAVSLAEFAVAFPDFTFPVFCDGIETRLSAKGLGHPLIPAEKRVRNDIELNTANRCLLITGSNMSGKSTMLRTLGQNILLAQAGGPVCAHSLELSTLALETSLHLNDSLDQGLSSFYAEVSQLVHILKRAQGNESVVYLIDELFRGTNNRERLIGSQHFIRALAKTNAIGAVTTHDLELAQLETTETHVRNTHFEETIQNEEMSFSFRLKPGPCVTTNALRIMAKAGLPVEPAKI